MPLTRAVGLRPADRGAPLKTTLPQKLAGVADPGEQNQVGYHMVEARLTCSCPQMPTQLYQLPVYCYEILG